MAPGSVAAIELFTTRFLWECLIVSCRKVLVTERFDGTFTLRLEVRRQVQKKPGQLDRTVRNGCMFSPTGKLKMENPDNRSWAGPKSVRVFLMHEGQST